MNKVLDRKKRLSPQDENIAWKREEMKREALSRANLEMTRMNVEVYFSIREKLPPHLVTQFQKTMVETAQEEWGALTSIVVDDEARTVTVLAPDHKTQEVINGPK